VLERGRPREKSFDATRRQAVARPRDQ